MLSSAVTGLFYLTVHVLIGYFEVTWLLTIKCDYGCFIIINFPYCPQWVMGLQQCVFSTGSCLLQLPVPALPMTNPSQLVQCQLSFPRWFWVFFFFFLVFFCMQVSFHLLRNLCCLTSFKHSADIPHCKSNHRFGHKKTPPWAHSFPWWVFTRSGHTA